MMNKEQFSKQFHAKSANIEGVNRLLQQGCEFETCVTIAGSTLRDNLIRMGGGFASNPGVNDGNGFNPDLHCDGSGDTYSHNAYEISTSPFKAFTYQGIKEEMTKNVSLLESASVHGLFHGTGSSTHLHNSIAVLLQRGANGYEAFSLLDNLKIDAMYEHVARVFVKFMPLLKWFSMTSPNGARGAHGNSYDTCDGDTLFSWFANPRNYNVTELGRSSYFRVHQALKTKGVNENYDIIHHNSFHWENRMMDACASPTVLSAWFALNRAISLWAFDFAENGYVLPVTSQDAFNSKDAMRQHAQSWKRVNRTYITSLWNELLSYLTKYFKKSGCLDAIEVLDKLVECPVPQYLEEQGLGTSYAMAKVEKLFNTRNRTGNEELRNRYMDAIKAMLVPMADSLNEFHENVARKLGIERKQAVSLYQMFKRENVEIDFMGGRIVYMGD